MTGFIPVPPDPWVPTATDSETKLFPAATMDALDEHNDGRYATTEQGALADSAYQLPEAGVPATDLEEAVQTSLGKADGAVPNTVEGRTALAASPELGAAYAPLAGPTHVAGSVPAGVGWDQSKYPVYPSIRIDGLGNIVGSAGYSAADYFGMASDALTDPTSHFYVSPSGNDSTGNGTEGNPWRTINKAIGTGVNGMALDSDTALVHLDVSEDPYAFSEAYGWELTGSAAQSTRGFAIIAEGGPAYVGPYIAVGTPSKHGTYTNCYAITYTATTKPPIRVVDRARSDADGIHPDFTHAASAAACDSTPGSWYYDTGTTTLLIHRLDTLPVTIENTFALVYKVNALFGRNTVGVVTGSFYARGIDFIGGRTAAVIANNYYTSDRTAIFEDCRFDYAGGVGATTANGFMTGASGWRGLVGLFGCSSSAPYKDCYNAHNSIGGASITHFLTVNCVGKLGGVDPAGTSLNGWTLHEAVKGIDIAGSYSRTRGGTVHNIDQTVAYLLGTKCFNDAGDEAAGGSIPPTLFKAADTAKLWLERCVPADDNPATLAYAVGAVAAIAIRNGYASPLPVSGTVGTF